MSKVTLISECFIRPQSEVEESERKHYLRPVDLRCLSLPYPQCGQLFRKPDDYIPCRFFNNLKLSLSLALVHFYPLAGRLATDRFEDSHSCSIYIDCEKGPGAKLSYAAALDISVADIVSPNTDVPVVVRSFFDMGERAVSHDGHTRPLLSAQVTELADGVFLGVSISHCVADGSSFLHFLSMWSEIFTGSSISRVPIYDHKPRIPRGYGPIIKLPYLEPDEFITRPTDVGQLRERVFQFSSKTMAMLKAKANDEAELFRSNDISSFLALSALVWRCITRARKLASDETTVWALVVSLRSRCKPPLAEECFGNIFTSARVVLKVGELLASSLGSAAMLLHQAVVGLDGEAAQAEMSRTSFQGSKMWLPIPPSSDANPVKMNGAPRMNMYEPEFGLGRAIAVPTGLAIKWDGKVMVFTGSQGYGSVELHINLAPQTMDHLLSDQEFLYFASDSNSCSGLHSRI